jgi:hypothetical protein
MVAERLGKLSFSKFFTGRMYQANIRWLSRFGEAVRLFENQVKCIGTNAKLIVDKPAEIIDNLATITISVFERDEEGDEQYELFKKFLEIKGNKKPNVEYRCPGDVDTERWKKLDGIIATRILYNPLGSFKYSKLPTVPEIGICVEILQWNLQTTRILISAVRRHTRFHQRSVRNLLIIAMWIWKRMKLYFTTDAKIIPEYSALFNQIAVDIRKPFTDIIESISRQNKDSIDWWVSSPASRNTNTFVSPLFHYCCCIVLLQELILAKKSVSIIITDSRALKKIVEGYITKQRANVRVKLISLPPKQLFKELIRPTYTMFGLPLKYLFFFLAAKLTQSLRKPLPSEPLILIDTFAMPGYIERDRYYTGMLDVFSEEEKQRIWFVPHLYGFRMCKSLQVMIQLRESKNNFILKDDFLKFMDYWCLWKHLFRVRKLSIKPLFFCGVDISALVCEELTGFRGISSTYTSLLNYRFAKRLKDAGVKLRLVIDWFENLNVDKGWNAGFRFFFPDIPSIGYQGFTPVGFELNIYPTATENESKTLPKEIGVIGRALITPLKKYCPDIKVRLVPAFRYQGVWENRKYYPEENIFTILVALPLMISDAVEIFGLLAHTANESTDKTRFWFKPHPATSQSQIQDVFDSVWPKQFEFVVGDFNELVEKANLLISSASSAAMETLAKGIPVIVVGNNSGLTRNPIPKTITEDIWSLCYSSQEIAGAILFYQNRSDEKTKEYKEIGKQIRAEFFEPVTRGGVRQFLGIED